MPLRLNSPMPALEGATEWLNGEPELSGFVGVPVLVHFWSVGCHICHENLPKIKAFQAQYAPQGLKSVAFHMPRSEAELDLDEVRRQLELYHIDEPCGADHEHALADAFENRFVPAYFLYDAEGKLRARTAGDAGLASLETALRKLFPAGA